jgi:hypothetical protein
MSENHIYESALPNFLDWAAWVIENCTQEEIDCFYSEDMPVSEEKNNLYMRWITDQQITKHTVMQDGNVISEKNYSV